MAQYDPIIRFYDDPGHPYWPNNTASIKSEIMAIATEHGYTGAAPKTIAGAIDVLADTLAGEDVSSPRSIAGAIHALAPYIGSGGGGAEQYGTGIEMSINSSTNNIPLTFAVLTTTDVTDGDSYRAATIGSVEFTATPNGVRCFVKGGAHIAVSGLGNEFNTATMTLDDAEFTDFEVKTIGLYTYVLFTVPETGDPDSYLVLNCNVG